MIRKNGRRAFSAILLAAFLLLFSSGCQARPGTNAAPKPASSSSSSGKEEKAEKKARSAQPEKKPEKEEESSAAPAPAVDPEAEAQRLLADRIGELCFYYTGNFDLSDTPNTAQIYWSVFKWHTLDPNYRPPDKPDYNGYEQLDAKTLYKLVQRWYGPEVPPYEGNVQALGDPATGELVNVSKDGGTYYFLEVEMPMEEKHILQNARVDEDGILTVRFNAEDSSGVYLRTYLCKLKPDGEGGYYLVSLNKGQT